MKMDARTALLDAAEQLFGQHGISAVSDRKIAEAARNSNHSAVGYHFGGRTGLLEALSIRHSSAMEEHRARLFATSDSLRGDIEALVLPVTDLLSALPRPSWRARFLQQALTDPNAMGAKTAWPASAPVVHEISRSVGARLSHIDTGVIEGRGRMMMHVMVSACADMEARPDVTPEVWRAAGIFLCESMVGLLAAPSSQVLPRYGPNREGILPVRHAMA